jgi:hypothetical protein
MYNNPSLPEDFLFFSGCKSSGDMMSVASKHPFLEECNRTIERYRKAKEDFDRAHQEDRERAHLAATMKLMFEDGIIEGRAEERRRLIKSMLAKLALERVSELTRLPVEEVARIAAEP